MATATITARGGTAVEAATTHHRAVVAVHLDLDGAWSGAAGRLGALPTVDARAWGPRLRFSALRHEVEAFYQYIDPQLGDAHFIAYGSGDFHHLSALWLRRFLARSPARSRRVTVVSFDNHPDWDIRPPAWCCGSWINRALELPGVETVSIWGLGSFENWGWHRLVGNHRDARRGRLTVQAWADERNAADQARPQAILRGNWREKFTAFASNLQDTETYVTIDLDCLREGEAVTNWENGFFSIDDVRWALEELRTHGVKVAAGDICGAWSPQGYARWKQCFAATMDHPKLPDPDPAAALVTNLAAFRTLWPALTGGDEHDADRHEQRADD